jgi:hypothetical protein
LFSNNLSLLSFLNIRDQVSHPYKATDKIVNLRILIFTFLDSRREDELFHTTQCIINSKRNISSFRNDKLICTKPFRLYG